MIETEFFKKRKTTHKYVKICTIKFVIRKIQIGNIMAFL